MNILIEKLLTLQYGKQCPAIKMIATDKGFITVHFENGNKAKFKINLQHVKEGTA